MRAVTADDLTAGVRELGVSGRVVCLHSSLRSFGEVAGGAAAVIDAFLAEGCTVLVPSFSWTYAVAAPVDLRPARNGLDYGTAKEFPPAGIFDPATMEIDGRMGAIPAEVVRRPERARGDHPLCSFAAEERAGRTLFRRWANGPDGEIRMVPVGGCSDGFDAFAPLLAPVKRETRVGASAWIAYPAAEMLSIAIRAIQRTPALTRCADPACVRCCDAVAGGPLLDQRSS